MRNVKRVTGGHKTSQNVCASAAFSAWLRSSSAFFTCQDLGSSAWFTESVAFASAVSCSKLSAPGDPSLRASGSSPRVLLKRIGLHLAKCGHGWPWMAMAKTSWGEIMWNYEIDMHWLDSSAFRFDFVQSENQIEQVDSNLSGQPYVHGTDPYCDLYNIVYHYI